MKLNKDFFKKNKEYINFYLLVIILISVGVLMPMFSRMYNKNYVEKINKNGILSKAKVTIIGNMKGPYVEVLYTYKDKDYVINESNYKSKIINYNWPVLIYVDTLNPENAYIVR